MMWKQRITRSVMNGSGKKQAFYDVLMFSLAFVLCVALCIFLVVYRR